MRFRRLVRTLLALALATALLGTVHCRAQGVEIGYGSVDPGFNTSGFGSGVSFSVEDPGDFSTQPANQSVVVGFDATFTGEAFQGGDAYQWQISTNHGTTWSDLSDNATLSGSNTTTLTVSNATLKMTGLQFRVINIAYTTTSTAANLTVLPLLIDVPPGNQTVSAGATATFTTHVVSSSNVTYQWLKNNLAIKGATQANLTLPNVQAKDVGTYVLKATNALGSVKSPSAKLTITKAAPSIITPPSPATVSPGAKATFTVSAQGTAPFTYRWAKTGGRLANSRYVSGVFTPTLTISKVTSANAGTYQVTITNSAGHVTTTPVALTVN